MDAAPIELEGSLERLETSGLIVGIGTPRYGPPPEILEPPPRVRLVQLAREAATTCPKQPRVTHFEFQGDGPHLSRELLALLTLSYGTGVFTLERMFEQLRQDVLFRSLTCAVLPHPNTLRGFRRLERPALTSSLDAFLTTAFKLAIEAQEREHDMTAWLEALALRRFPANALATVGVIVQDRINQATWTDRMLQDY